ncbi:unnamed protein product [Phytophthora fragariaefolia]|uniref:Unnamed protein product n=1 Tax=Phytophthora fragariaefolia TaxID=1490495 RepID=A0A9W6XKE9_9STRA|nr:unnamed protein product [Phytophthora fragariaefolia]
MLNCVPAIWNANKTAFVAVWHLVISSYHQHGSASLLPTQVGYPRKKGLVLETLSLQIRRPVITHFAELKSSPLKPMYQACTKLLVPLILTDNGVVRFPVHGLAASVRACIPDTGTTTALFEWEVPTWNTAMSASHKKLVMLAQTGRS